MSSQRWRVEFMHKVARSQGAFKNRSMTIDGVDAQRIAGSQRSRAIRASVPCVLRTRVLREYAITKSDDCLETRKTILETIYVANSLVEIIGAEANDSVH